MIKTIFRTPYGERERHYIEAGRPIANVYAHEIDDKGMKVLVKTGETNIQAKIEEAYEETRIENIIARVTAGDTSMLRANGQWIDTTEIPKNLIEARKAIQKLENTWNALPAQLKEKYNYSVEEYIAAAGTETWLIDNGYIKPSPKQPEEPQDNKKGGNEE